jgi:hypothetical protein
MESRWHAMTVQWIGKFKQGRELVGSFPSSLRLCLQGPKRYEKTVLQRHPCILAEAGLTN